MNKFKVGDKVILKKEFHDEKIYTIKQIMFKGERIVLNNNVGYSSKYFKKIKEKRDCPLCEAKQEIKSLEKELEKNNVTIDDLKSMIADLKHQLE